MSETVRIIAGMAILIAAFVALVATLITLFSWLAPASWQNAINTIIMFGSSYIQQARGLVNQFVLTPAVVTGCLSVFVFSKPLIWLAKLTYKVAEYFVKGY